MFSYRGLKALDFPEYEELKPSIYKLNHSEDKRTCLVLFLPVQTSKRSRKKEKTIRPFITKIKKLLKKPTYLRRRITL